MAQVYTYYSTETEFPSAKLSAHNINTVAAGDFTVKLSAPLICGADIFEDQSAEEPAFILRPYIYTGDYNHNIAGVTQRENKRLFKLLEDKVNVLDVRVGIAEGSCQYLKFTHVGNRSHVATLSNLP